MLSLDRPLGGALLRAPAAAAARLTLASRAFLAAPPAGFGDGRPLAARRATRAAPGRSRPRQHHVCARSASAAAARRRRLPARSCRSCAASSCSRRVRARRRRHRRASPASRLPAQCPTPGRRASSATPTRARIDATSARRWRVAAGGVHYRAPSLVDAAGAWADGSPRAPASPPIGPVPHRRSIFTFARAGPRRHSLAARSPARRARTQARRRPAARLAGQRRSGRAAGRAARGVDVALAIERIERRRRSHVRPRRAGPGCARSSPTATWSAASPGRWRRLLLARRAGRLRHPDRGGDGRSVRRARSRRAAAGAPRRVRPRRGDPSPSRPSLGAAAP